MNTTGSFFRVTTFGESHGVALGAVIDGCPAGLLLSVDDISRELFRRRPGQSVVTTPRQESDLPEILSGIFEGKTTGAPIAVIVRNSDQRSRDYEALREIFRPGHSDEVWHKKYGFRDFRGGGRQSGRETLGRVIGGAIAKKLLSCTSQTRIVGSVQKVGKILAKKYEESVIETNIVRCADREAAEKMIIAIQEAQRAGESLGGIIEIRVQQVPPGLGSPVFGKIEAAFGAALLSLGTTRSFEYGGGIAVAERYGSAQNQEGEGISGGVTTGDDILIRVALKPTPSISKKQLGKTKSGILQEIEIHGRHDPCIAPRFVPVAESMVALVLADAILAPPDRIDQIFSRFLEER